MKLDHIGIAVKNIDEALKLWQAAFGLKLIAVKEVAEQQVKVAMLELGDTHIELLEPVSQDSTVNKFIERRGEGLHHIGIEVKDIERILKAMKNQGARLLDETPRKGVLAAKVAFIHPKDTNGVLVELCQK